VKVGRNVLIIIFILLPFFSQAQLCQGSLGDPVVNIGFGSGTGLGSPLPAGVTNYIFTDSPCPDDGYYTVVNKVGDCFGTTWHQLSEDHTPNDVNGYMMLVNASFAPGDFFTTTVNNLCGGTTYEFAAWIVNVLKLNACADGGKKPDVTFRIETTSGQLLQSFSTGDILSDTIPKWKQYGFFFQTPANVSSVVIRMRNNAPGGCGNDLALDDITFRPCGPNLNISISGYNSSSITKCQNVNDVFSLVGNLSAGFGTYTYQWQSSMNGGAWIDMPGETSSTLKTQLLVPATYQFRLTVAETNNISVSTCRTNSKPVQITITPGPAVNLPDTTNTCLDTSLSISVNVGNSFLWTGVNGFTSTQQTISFSPVKKNIEGKYVVVIATNTGCSGIDSTTIIVRDPPVMSAGNDLQLCTGQTGILDATGNGSYSWSPATGLSSTTVLKPVVTGIKNITYTLTLKDQYGCSNKDDVVVTVLPAPIVSAGKNVEIFEGDSVQLHGSIAGNNTSFTWSPLININGTNTLSPTVWPTGDFVYTLNVSSQSGCQLVTSSVFVKVYKKIKVPNAFSPNGDGVNDIWIIDGLETYPDVRMQLFNRYGKKVFEQTAYEPWNGTSHDSPLPAGVYYYYIDTRKNKKLTGWVIILK
jgi:gliding motility-associated-like protein